MYEEWLRKYGGLQPGNGNGFGNNQGGPGQGQRPIDESVDSGFKAEKTNSQLQAGKMLLQWKTKEMSDPGKAKEEYARQLRDVKQGVSEAIVQEQVPPGYHDAIKKYFDSIAESAPKQAAPEPAPK